MVFEAIKALKERNGSSIQAIKKHITSSHPTLNFTPHQMRSALKKGTEAGKFVKVRPQHQHNSESSCRVLLLLVVVRYRFARC